MSSGIKDFFKGIGGKINAPDININDFNIKTPDININPHHETKVNKNKEQRFDLPDFSFKNPKIEETNLDLDLKSPKEKKTKKDIPDIGEAGNNKSTIYFPQVDVELNKPEFGGKIKAPDVNIPDVNLTAPDVKIKGPKVDLPDVSVKVPKVDVPTVDIDAKLPKVDVDVSAPKIKTPKIDLPDLSIKAPNVDLPDFSFKGPKIDKPKVDVPKIDIDVKSPKIKTPKVDLPDVSIHGPKITAEVPEVDLNADVHGGIKGFFKGIGGKIKAPDVNIPDVNLTAPDVKIKGPKVDLPDVSVKVPKVDVPTVDIDAKLPKVDVDVSAPKIKTPKIDLPDLSIKAPNVDLPDFSFKGPKIDKPKVDLPKVVVDSPEVQTGIKGFFKGIGGKIKAPEVNIPDVNLSAPDIQVKGPKVDLPDVSVKIPKVDIPNVDIDAKLAKVDVDLSSFNIKSPFIDLPDLSIKTPNFVSPDFDLKNEKDIFNLNATVVRQLNITDPSVIQNENALFGIDLPMTVINQDWYWSPHSIQVARDNRKILYRTLNEKSNLTNDVVKSGSFTIGQSNGLASQNFSLKNINNSYRQDFTVRPSNSFNLPISFSEPTNIEFELKKATIKKDSQISSDNNTSVSNFPGEITFQKSKIDPQVSLNTDKVSKSKFSTRSFFKRKLSSSSSITNIDSARKSTINQNDSINRSESADPNTRIKIDYSIPRKCFLFLRPNFDGLGIHIACDKKTRRSPYIHEVEADSPGVRAGLKKHDFILEVNDEDAVNMEFNVLIKKIQDYIKENNLCLTVGNEKAYKKWIKNRNSSISRKSKSNTAEKLKS